MIGVRLSLVVTLLPMGCGGDVVPHEIGLTQKGFVFVVELEAGTIPRSTQGVAIAEGAAATAPGIHVDRLADVVVVEVPAEDLRDEVGAIPFERVTRAILSNAEVSVPPSTQTLRSVAVPEDASFLVRRSSAWAPLMQREILDALAASSIQFELSPCEAAPRPQAWGEFARHFVDAPGGNGLELAQGLAVGEEVFVFGNDYVGFVGPRERIALGEAVDPTRGLVAQHALFGGPKYFFRGLAIDPRESNSIRALVVGTAGSFVGERDDIISTIFELEIGNGTFEVVSSATVGVELIDVAFHADGEARMLTFRGGVGSYEPGRGYVPEVDLGQTIPPGAPRQFSRLYGTSHPTRRWIVGMRGQVLIGSGPSLGGWQVRSIMRANRAGVQVFDMTSDRDAGLIWLVGTHGLAASYDAAQDKLEELKVFPPPDYNVCLGTDPEQGLIIDLVGVNAGGGTVTMFADLCSAGLQHRRSDGCSAVVVPEDEPNVEFGASRRNLTTAFAGSDGETFYLGEHGTIFVDETMR